MSTGTLIVIVACAAIALVAAGFTAVAAGIGTGDGGHTRRALRRAGKGASAEDEVTESWMHGLVGPAIVMACRPLVAARIRVGTLLAAAAPQEADDEFTTSITHAPLLPAPALAAPAELPPEVAARLRARIGEAADDDELAELRAALRRALHHAATVIAPDALFDATSSTWTPRPLSAGRDLPAFLPPPAGPELQLPPGWDAVRPELTDTSFELPDVIRAALFGMPVDAVVDVLFGKLEREVASDG